MLKTPPIFKFFLLIGIFLLTACGPQSLPTQPITTETKTPAASTPTDVPVPNTGSQPTSLPVTGLAITSTLDGQTSLPHRIAWVAQPSVPEDQVKEVDFLIDGQLAFVEQHAPYTYGRDGNYLVTSFLPPGQHSLTVQVITTGGEKAGSTVQASVAAPAAPPAALASSAWSRQVTDADVKQATSHQPPPPGQWGLSIDSVGWMVHDPQGGGLLFDVDYTSDGKVDLRPSIEKPPFPNTTGGAFCDEPDQSVLWTYTIGDGGKSLTLSPASSDPCGDRLAILMGTWTLSTSAATSIPATLAPTTASQLLIDATQARLRLGTFVYGGSNVDLYIGEGTGF